MDIGGMPMVVRVAQTCIQVIGETAVVVSTPDDEIEEVCHKHGINVHRSSMACMSGTDRVAEFAKNSPSIGQIVNVQGDEPMLTTQVLESFLNQVQHSNHVSVGVTKLVSPEQVNSSSTVKVALSEGRLVYASRSPLPVQLQKSEVTFWKHTGLYSFTPASLEFFAQTRKGALELAENVEILRLVENGFAVRALPVETYGRAVDTERDLNYVRSQWPLRTASERQAK